jgi:hypothetical protein
MILSTFALAAALAAPQDGKAVTLARVFPKGEKLAYSVTSNLQVETRPYGIQTFMPEEMDLNYKFTTEVKQLKNDGVAIVRYTRPTMTQVDGETYERPPKTTVEKVNFNYDLTLSPINKILEMKDLNPPKKPKPGGTGGGGALSHFATRNLASMQGSLQAVMGQFISDLYRLALNVGSIDSAMDFSPKLPLDDVKVGDTWKETVSYQPQKLKGKDGKQAVQRLDYTFTYKGAVKVNGKPFERVTATLDLNTDLGAFLNQLMDTKPDESHLKSIPIQLKQTIDYDLDPATKRTVFAVSKSEGGFSINITDLTVPVQEERLKGATTLRLVTIGATGAADPKAKSK